MRYSYLKKKKKNDFLPEIENVVLVNNFFYRPVQQFSPIYFLILIIPLKSAKVHDMKLVCLRGGQNVLNSTTYFCWFGFLFLNLYSKIQDPSFRSTSKFKSKPKIVPPLNFILLDNTCT